MDPRQGLGRAGERLAARYLEARGGSIIGRNLAVDGGEIDLLVSFAGVRTVVEVRTVQGRFEPDERFGSGKRRQVRALASRLGARRVDVIGIGLSPGGVALHWLRDVPSD